MKRTKHNIIQGNSRVSANTSTTLARSMLYKALGMSHDGDRDLYNALGYKTSLGYDDYKAQYKRHDIAKAIIKRPAQATWAGELHLHEVDTDEDTKLEKEFDVLAERVGLKNKFARLDRLTSLGKYGVLVLGLSDCKKRDDFKNPVTSTNLKLNYVKPVGEGSSQIQKWNNNPSDIRYGLPELYDITLKSHTSGKETTLLQVHHTRVIHVCWDLMEDETEGTPVLEAVFNRLYDLEKLVGGSAEMFWRGARPGYQGIIDPEYTMGPTEQDSLKDKVAEYENGLRRMFMQQGVKLEALAPQVTDPSNHVKVQVQMISAVTGLPQRVLLGAEQGELASGQDADAWKTLIQDRRTEQVEPSIIRPFVEKMIKYGVLPAPQTKKYSVGWSDLFAPSEKERAETGKTRAIALSEYSKNPLASEIMPPTVFSQLFLGFSKDQIKLVEQMKEKSIDDEETFRLREIQREMNNPPKQPNEGGSNDAPPTEE
jgi:hypothetical protein